MRVSLRPQRGAAFLAFVAVLGSLAILFVIGQSTWQSKQLANELPQRRTQRVTAAADALRAWYVANAATLDVPGAALPSSSGELLAAAGVPQQWRLSAGISELRARDRIRYRVIAVWAEGEDNQTPTFDTASGTLNLCPNTTAPCLERAAAIIEGYQIQADLFERTVENLNSLALAAQAYFHSRWLSDPDHDLAANYFRKPIDPTDCTNRPGEFGCYDSWHRLDDPSVNVLQVLGEPASRAYDAWGGAIEVTNGPLVNPTQRPPYRMAFRATTPWGEQIVIYAVQRL